MKYVIATIMALFATVSFATDTKTTAKKDAPVATPAVTKADAGKPVKQEAKKEAPKK